MASKPSRVTEIEIIAASGPDLARWMSGEVVGHIVAQGREPFDRIAKRLPSASVENKIVVANLPIYATGFPNNFAEIRLLLTPHQAEDLARQLLIEAEKARESPPEPEP